MPTIKRNKTYAEDEIPAATMAAMKKPRKRTTSNGRRVATLDAFNSPSTRRTIRSVTSVGSLKRTGAVTTVEMPKLDSATHPSSLRSTKSFLRLTIQINTKKFDTLTILKAPPCATICRYDTTTLSLSVPSHNHTVNSESIRTLRRALGMGKGQVIKKPRIQRTDVRAIFMSQPMPTPTPEITISSPSTIASRQFSEYFSFPLLPASPDSEQDL